MLGQFASEFLALYPGANILVATKDDFENVKRKTLMSRIRKVRPRWKMNPNLFTRHPAEIEKVKEAQSLLIELGPVLVENNPARRAAWLGSRSRCLPRSPSTLVEKRPRSLMATGWECLPQAILRGNSQLKNRDVTVFAKFLQFFGSNLPEIPLIWLEP